MAEALAVIEMAGVVFSSMQGIVRLWGAIQAYYQAQEDIDYFASKLKNTADQLRLLRDTRIALHLKGQDDELFYGTLKVEREVWDTLARLNDRLLNNANLEKWHKQRASAWRKTRWAAHLRKEAEPWYKELDFCTEKSRRQVAHCREFTQGTEIKELLENLRVEGGEGQVSGNNM